jgi:hypothetical protein
MIGIGGAAALMPSSAHKNKIIPPKRNLFPFGFFLAVF